MMVMKFIATIFFTLACSSPTVVSQHLHLRRSSFFGAAANAGKINLDVRNHSVDGKSVDAAMVLAESLEERPQRLWMLALLVLSCCCPFCGCSLTGRVGTQAFSLFLAFLVLMYLTAPLALICIVSHGDIGRFEVVICIAVILQLTCGCCVGCAIIAHVRGLDHPFARIVLAALDPEATARSAKQNKAQHACIDRYMSILDRLEHALDMQGEIRTHLNDLDMCDYEIQQKWEGQFLNDLRDNKDWPTIEVKRKSIEDRLTCIPLCLSATLQGPNEVVVLCTNLAGNSLAQLSMRGKEDTVCELRAAVHNQVPLPVTAPKNAFWKLISHEGQLVEEMQKSVTIAELFGF